ncbi:MAG: type II toxin-antitoxin system VapC family toxin [Desulfuromonadaceae bacterium]|nr:type II toxin-antitoxin system VapC family toxin [Desulfuromonadaceae bacterium]
MEPLTVFLDSNIIFSIAWSGAETSRAYILFELQQRAILRLFISPLVMEETLSNIKSKKPSAMPFLLELIKSTTLLPDAISGITDERLNNLPNNDRILLQTAIAHGIRWFITGNSRDFQTLYGCRIGHTTIIAPRDFLETRGRDGELFP